MTPKQKRVINMKVTFAALILLAALLLTSCTGASAARYSMVGASPDAALLSDAMDSAVRAYFGLSEDGDITEYMLAQVTKITVTRSVFAELELEAGKTLADVFINGEYSCGGAIERVLYTERYGAIERALSAAAAESGSDWGYNKYFSYFSIKDPTDPLMDSKAKIDMFNRFPVTTDMRARYVIDPQIMYRETSQILQILYGGGLLDCFMTDGTVDCACLSVFPNLKVVEYAGVELRGVPSGVEAKEIAEPVYVDATTENFNIYAVYYGK